MLSLQAQVKLLWQVISKIATCGKAANSSSVGCAGIAGLFQPHGLGHDFVNYAKLEAYYDFGGIRLEDDVLITPDDVEAVMK